MKRWILCGLLIFMCFNLFAQSHVESETIKISPQSELTITGNTNINKFRCEFDTSCFKNAQEIKYVSKNSAITFQNAKLELQNINFDCGSRPINKDFHDLLKTEKFPSIVLEVKSIDLKNENAIAHVSIIIAGKQKNYKVVIAITETKQQQQFKGSLNLNIKDFNLEPPKKLFGAIVVKEDIEVNFNLKIKT